MRPASASPILIKRYGGSRHYDTQHLRYVTRDDLADLILNGERFVVRDAETGEDLTRAILDAVH
jgi:polyhydroxyalkanoate synthesis regulator protein